jgi:parallel beta-helix repeat protein
MSNKVALKAIVLTLLIVAIGIKYGKIVTATPGTIVVPSIGYETIQKAINTANPGDIIKVNHGTYYENLIVNKSVSIIGENPANTIIDGSGEGTIVNIIRPNVLVSGFTLQNGKQEVDYCGISIGSNFVVVNNTLLRNNYDGLIFINSNNCRILNNVIVNNTYAGIFVHAGNSSGNIFFQNTIENNNIGLLAFSPANTFYHNNFINNTNQYSAFSAEILDNGVEGNYWSDYNGSDTDLDGIGSSAINGDNHPLMGMFANFTVNYATQIYFLSTICNSTISNFEFNESNGNIGFDVIGSNGTLGFCRIAVPLTLIQNESTILLDGNSLLLLRDRNDSTYNYRCFLYDNTGVTRKITVLLKLPEGVTPPSFLVPALIAVSLVAIVLVSIILIRGSSRKEIRSRFLKR